MGLFLAPMEQREKMENLEIFRGHFPNPNKDG